MHDANAVTTMDLFFSTITEMIQNLALIYKSIFSKVINLGFYILQYHPFHWTDFANCSQFDDDHYQTKLIIVLK